MTHQIPSEELHRAQNPSSVQKFLWYHAMFLLCFCIAVGALIAALAGPCGEASQHQAITAIIAVGIITACVGIITACVTIRNLGSPTASDVTSVAIVDQVKAGNLEEVKACLAKGADPNSTQGEETLLHLAVQKENKAIVLELLHKGASVDAKGQHSRTPLHHAAKQGHVEVAQALLEHHGDVNAQARNGVTPLHTAAGEGHIRVVELLLRQGADPMATEKGNSTPLHRAAGKGHPEVVACLLEAKVHVNARGWHHWTPLHYAAYAGSVETVEMLLKHGADASLTEQKGKQPLDIAEEEGRIPCAKALQRVTKRGASVTADDFSRVGEEQQLASIEEDVECRLWQTLNPGVRFGEQDQYIVQQAKHDHGNHVAIVVDELQGSEYFAKFYAYGTLYKTELDFYMSWRTMEDTARQTASHDEQQHPWPVMERHYGQGELPRITASCIILEKGSVTLADRLKEWREWRMDTAVDLSDGGHAVVPIIEAVAELLSLLHRNGWVFRDLKPSHIMYFSDADRWKLVDFVLTAKAGSQAPVMYTTKFAPPEVVQAHFDAQPYIIAQPSMDMWSLGMLLLHAFAREPPFAHCDEKEWLKMLLGLSKFPFEEDPIFLSSLLPLFAVEPATALLKRDPTERCTIDSLLYGGMFKGTGATPSLPQK